MTATTEPPAATVEAPARVRLNRAEGVELLGAVHGCGYRDGASLVRRQDGQMVQLGPLMYALLEHIDGERDGGDLAKVMSEHLGRRLDEEHVVALARKLAQQGLLAGTEENAPPRRNPLLALRFKVLVTNPKWTQRLTSPFAFLFRPWVMWPVLAAFVGVFWFVLIHKGVASATAQAFKSPVLLLLVFALAVVSAGFHELGHAAACRYAGATPGGMGVGLYLVWPAFYTDVTDTYRLPKRDRLRVDLAGLYFNAVVAVLTMAVWLVWRSDALLLLAALQVLQMVKQLSPVIRADGYHILSDATGVPDLYSHMGPTLKRLIPGHRNEPSALSGKARVFVTVWVLIVVPVLISLMVGAVVLLPRVLTSAWDSGHHVILAIPHQVSHGQVLDLLASILRLAELILPALGSALVTQKILRTTIGRARSWSGGRPRRQAILAVALLAASAGAAWALWPSGQYQPVRANQNGTIAGLVELVSAPGTVARPSAAPVPTAQLTPGTHLAVSMIPVGGATKSHPALFVIPGPKGKAPVAVISSSSPNPAGASSAAGNSPAAGGATTTGSTAPAASTTTTPSSGSASPPTQATAFPFALPSAPGPGGTQAVAENTTDGGVVYDVAYSLVTVTKGAPVTNTNSAFALAHCKACTTVAVSFQVVLIIGQSNKIVPINAAGALNYECPACTTTALADQLVVTLKSKPSQALLAQLESDLKQLGALPALGASGTPAAVASAVAAVQQQIETQLDNSGLPANPISQTPTSSTASTTPTTTGTTPAGSPATSTSSSSSQTSGAGSDGSPTSAGQSSGTAGSSSSPSTSQAGSSTATTTTTSSTASTSTGTTTSPATTTPASSSSAETSTTGSSG